MKKTKIICTIGPSSNNKETIRDMLLKGMNVARFNFSHGSYESHEKAIKTFIEVRDELKMPAAVLLDTKGPEIRTGCVENDKVDIISGNDFELTTEEILGNDKKVSISFKDLPNQIPIDSMILIDDGKIKLKVIDKNSTSIFCKIIDGGELGNRKSINMPYLDINMPFLSEKDKADLLFGIKNDIDYVAASFTRSKQDIVDIRNFLDFHGGHDIRIIAKIENMSGVRNIDEILSVSNGIMIARGDMGVEIDYTRLPGIQKDFIKRCYRSGKIVITATQMLESMIYKTMPTRAEISDVANAVFDGTSAVMLSGETAMGKHPSLVVETMAKIVIQAENDAMNINSKKQNHDIDKSDIANAICDAACTTANDINAKAIIAVTKSGHTARLVSKFRPRQPIIASTPSIETFHQLSMSWGVFPVLALNQRTTDTLFRHAVDCAKSMNAVKEGDKVVITAGIKGNETSLLKAQVVE